MTAKTVWQQKPICPICNQRVARHQSHSSFAPTFKLHHLQCRVVEQPIAASGPPQQEQLFDSPPTNPVE
jgi:hypothetical protein